MKKIIKIQITEKSLLSEEIKEVINKLIDAKISLLADYYLKDVSDYQYQISQYSDYLKRNALYFKEKYCDWTDTWIGDVKPYILENFPDEYLLHRKKFANGNLYDCLHDMAEYSDLHDN